MAFGGGRKIEQEYERSFEILKKQQKNAGQKKKKELERVEMRSEECEENKQALTGEVLVGMVEEDKERQMVMDFQVCEVKKALAAGHKICRAGNVVQFGEKDEECFIRNKTTGKKVMMRKKGGSYVMDVGFVEKVAGGWVSRGVAEITVDSGAEESVCPLGWREWFGMVKAARKMNLVGAGGGSIEHYCSRRVRFTDQGF